MAKNECGRVLLLPRLVLREEVVESITREQEWEWDSTGNGDCGRHDSVNESLKSNDSVEISGFMIIRFGKKIMKQYDLANNLIHFFSSHEINQIFSEKQKIPL